MIPQFLITWAIAAGIGFGGAWQVQSWRYSAKEAKRDHEIYETTLESQRVANRAKTESDLRIITAQNAATARERLLRADATSSRNALVGLSHAADESLSRANKSHAACVVTATAQNIVLKASAERYRELGEVCDRHVNDIRKLSDDTAEK